VRKRRFYHNNSQLRRNYSSPRRALCRGRRHRSQFHSGDSGGACLLLCQSQGDRSLCRHRLCYKQLLLQFRVIGSRSCLAVQVVLQRFCDVHVMRQAGARLLW
jgi:hypothetical protein